MKEIVLISRKAYDNPLQDVDVRVRLTGSSGAVKELDAFWDGGSAWKVRLGFLEAGSWEYESACSDETDVGLHGQRGSVQVEPYKGGNPVYSHGALTVSKDGRRLAYADGTPFFWMGDTAWNGVLKAKPDDWGKYLDIRRKQGFTGVQCVMTQWRSWPADPFGDTAFTGSENIRINPEFFRRIDDNVKAINDHGLIAALVLVWACTPKDPGHYLPAGDAVKLARYIAARYHAGNVIWFLGGDGDYRGDRADHWRDMGRKVFGEKPDRVVTMHPGGQHWVADIFKGESWFGFVGYQSGHDDSAGAIKWLVDGPPAAEWKKLPVKPVIDLEPPYEAHLAYSSKEPITPHKVRRSLYWNLLIAPTAGVTYGHNGIWPWNERREVPADHPWAGEAPPWHEAVESEGADSVKILRRFFESLDWWKLVPAQELLAVQPGREDPFKYVAVSKAEKGAFAVAYLPEGGSVTLLTDGYVGSTAQWFDPREGRFSLACEITGSKTTFSAPDGRDWVLLVSPLDEI